MSATTHHPGAILANELRRLGVTPTEPVHQLQVSANQIAQIVNGKRAVTGDSALRLAHWNDPEYWMTLPVRFDLEIAKTQVGRSIKDMPSRPGLRAPPAKGPVKHVRETVE